MAIITVSREIGSIGDEIAQKVSNDLDYEFIDKAKIGETLSVQGISSAEFEKYDDMKPAIWDSLIIQQSRFFHVIKAIIYDFAGKNNTILLGRGTQVLLKDLPGILHVRIFAPLKIRLKRIGEQEGCDEKTAERILRRSDRESSGYLQSFFGEDWNDQNLYDILINTKTVSLKSATEMIKKTIDSSEYAGGFEETLARLSDLAMQEKAHSIILKVSGSDNIFVSDAQKGVITLSGTTNSMKVKENCELEVSKLNGVNSIKNEIFIPKSFFTG